MLVPAVAAGIALAFVANIVAGRLVGLAITALCSATMAFFLMPPIRSFRVAETHDIVTLAFYSATGLVFGKRKRAQPMVTTIDPVYFPTPAKRVETEVATVLADFRLSGTAKYLDAVDLVVSGDGFSLPCTREEVWRILSDVLGAAMRKGRFERVSICGGQLPSTRRLMVTAHYVWPPPLNRVITIGKRPEDCENLTFASWPLRAHACWFDNGYDRIYQISVDQPS